MNAVIEKSPIEEKLWAHLTQWIRRLPGSACLPDGADMGSVYAEHARQLVAHNLAFIAAQNVRHMTYVIDIVLIVFDGTCGHCVAIECDGHDYHERTKEQAARDKSRDRTLVRDGWRVLRFTGSEIHNYPRECVEEIRDLLITEFQRSGDCPALAAVDGIMP